MTLARISPRNIYLNLFGRAHFYWRSLKACNIAKRTCLIYVWTATFPWSYCSLKIHIVSPFRARSSKTIEYYSLWNARRSHRSCSARERDLQFYLKRDSDTGFFLWILENFWEQLFYKTPTEDCFWRIRDIIIIYSFS